MFPRWSSWGAIGVLLVGLVVGVFWLRAQSAMNQESARTVGQQAPSFELPNLTSGQMFSMGDYLGKKDVVVVGYMGFF